MKIRNLEQIRKLNEGSEEFKKIWNSKKKVAKPKDDDWRKTQNKKRDKRNK